jgi:fluoride exporter
MRKLALVCAGGFCGTLARYLLGAPLLALAHVLFLGHGGAIPWDTLSINLTGALALGVLYGIFERGALLPPAASLAFGTGFLGAYTTFSTFVYGGDTLVASGHALAGGVYLAGSLALGVGCAYVGYILGGLLVLVERRHRHRRLLALRANRAWWQHPQSDGVGGESDAPRELGAAGRRGGT